MDGTRQDAVWDFGIIYHEVMLVRRLWVNPKSGLLNYQVMINLVQETTVSLRLTTTRILSFLGARRSYVGSVFSQFGQNPRVLSFLLYWYFPWFHELSFPW